MKPDKFGDNEPVGGWLIREAVGFLMWLANQTRPDIADAERAVTRYANKPREVHWRTAIGVVHNLFLRVIFVMLYRRAAGLGWKRLRMQTTLAKQLTGDQFLVTL